MRYLFAPKKMLFLWFVALFLINMGYGKTDMHKGWVREGIGHEYISPLMIAAKKGDINQMKSLIHHGASLGECSKSKMTALHYAIGFSKQDAAVYLLEKGAPFNILDAWDNSPLSMARHRKQSKVIKALESKFLKGQHYGENFDNDDKHFILLIASYNNATWYTRNLDALFSQDHKKFTAIYMDDLSDDGTYQLVKMYLKKRNLENKVILIKNKVKRYCVGNYVFAVEKFCPDKAVLVTYDGDDWFNKSYALSYLNNVYKDPNIWMTYGNSIMYPQNIVTPFCKPIDPSLLLNKTFRQKCKKEVNWPIHHVRSFYTALWRHIKPEDLLDQKGEYFKIAEDVAFMSAMVEMSGPEHHKYINDPLYTYNMKNPLLSVNRFGSHQIHKNLKYICSKKPYDRINTLFPRESI